MNIIVLSWRDLANPLAGGSEVVVDRLLIGLSQRGHNVTLVCGGPVGRRPYRVIEAGNTYSQYFRVPLAVTRSYRNADVILDTENGIPFFSPLWSRRPKVCLVHHLHVDQWSDRFPSPIARSASFVERSIMPRIYKNVPFAVVSNSTRISLEEIGVPSDKITVIESGVTIPGGSQYNWESKSSHPLFVCIGRQVPHKRVDKVLEAWSLIAAEIDGELIIIGDGPENFAISEMSKSIPRVRIMGRVDDEERTRLLASAWFQINATRHEGWGVTVLEGAAVATPTLAFDVPGIRDSVIDDDTGVLVRRSNDEEVEDLALAWVNLARDPIRLKRLSESSHRRASEQTWERSIDQWEDLLFRVGLSEK